jgi:hypothetical protein
VLCYSQYFFLECEFSLDWSSSVLVFLECEFSLDFQACYFLSTLLSTRRPKLKVSQQLNLFIFFFWNLKCLVKSRLPMFFKSHTLLWDNVVMPNRTSICSQFYEYPAWYLLHKW